MNYDYANQELAIEFPKSITDKIYSTKIISEKGDFKVILCTVDTLLKGIELPLLSELYRAAIFTISSYSRIKRTMSSSSLIPNTLAKKERRR